MYFILNFIFCLGRESSNSCQFSFQCVWNFSWCDHVLPSTEQGRLINLYHPGIAHPIAEGSQKSLCRGKLVSGPNLIYLSHYPKKSEFVWYFMTLRSLILLYYSFLKCKVFELRIYQSRRSISKILLII